MSLDSLSLNSFFHQFPKADLHYHLLGGVRLETMLDLACKYGVELSEAEAKSYYRAYCRETGITRGGLSAQTLLYNKLLQQPEDFTRIVLEVAEDARDCNVRYIECLWNPFKSLPEHKAVVDALAEGIRLAKENTGIIIRMIACINRDQSDEQALDTARMIMTHTHPHILGIGLDCHPENVARDCYKTIAAELKEKGMKVSAHFSSGGQHQQWQDIEEAIKFLNVDRIDHGYSIVHNEEFAKECAERGIAFTVAPSNTHYLKKWPDREQWQEQHPSRRMARHGVNLVPCTDGWHLHNISSAECYRIMVEELGFDLNDIRQILANSLNGSWMEDGQRQQWLKEWTEEYDQLRGRLTWEPELSWRRVDYLHGLEKARS